MLMGRLPRGASAPRRALRRAGAAVLVCTATIGLPAAARAQVDQGRTELLASGGYALEGRGGGMTGTQQPGAAWRARPIIGAGVQHALRDRLLLAVEGAYLTGDRPQLPPGSRWSAWGMSLDVNGHYLFPDEWSERFVPYLLAGIGRSRSTVRASAPGFELRSSTSMMALNVGGGVRWTLSQRWAARPELRFVFGNRPHIRLSGGLSYAIRR